MRCSGRPASPLIADVWQLDIARMRLGPILAALIGCALVATLTATRSGGFILYLVAPFLLTWFIYSACVSWKRPEQRRLHAILAGMWLITITGIALLHVHWYRAARSSAETIVRAVETYKNQFGIYPATVDAAGIDLEPNGGEWRIFYSIREGKPSLMYWDTFEIFSTYQYDFDQRIWIHLVD